MKSALIAIAFYFLLCSCSNYTQIYQTKPITPGIVSDKLYYYENDTVKITYSFWQLGGTMAFTIYNKLSTPIYIDWKKSSFIMDGQKLNYWADETITKSSSYRVTSAYTSYAYYGLLGLSSSTTEGISHSLKPERTTFLAPHSSTIKQEYTLLATQPVRLPPNAAAGFIKNPVSNQPVPVTYKDFTQDNTPLSFRNFLTISMTEDFAKESYIDNGFYVSRISQMKSGLFNGKGHEEHNKMVWDFPFKSPTTFFGRTH